MEEIHVPIQMRIYIRAKHHYARHQFVFEQREDGRITCRVLDLQGNLVYHYFYPEDYYVTMNKELKFDEYELEWLGIELLKKEEI